MLNFDLLQTPRHDGDTLIEPPVADWPRLIEGVRRQRRGIGLTLAGVPVEELRRALRARLSGSDRDRPLLAAGHQPGYAHPGVWAKHVVVRHVARRLEADALDFVVDSDAPRSPRLTLPSVNGEQIVSQRDLVLSTGPAGSTHEGRPPASASVIAAARRTVADTLDERWPEPAIFDYLDGLAEACHAPDAVAQHLAGRDRVDRSFGVDLPEIRVSEAFGGPFLADLLLRADGFAAAYNDALADYRREQAVRHPDRPLPDLGRDGDRIETALWSYLPGERRRRLWVQRRGDRLHLDAERVCVGTLGVRELTGDAPGTIGGLAPWVIRPRALTLTLWARLLVCDLFVHGIGGAKYDRITDGLFRRYYQIEPPPYACVSATLRLPLPNHPTATTELASARHRLRDWRFNPDRYASGLPRDLLDERQRLIGESIRLRRARGPQAARRATFRSLREVTASLVRSSTGTGSDLAERVTRLERQAAGHRLADSREYFYALQPRPRLTDLADQLAAAAHLGT